MIMYKEFVNESIKKISRRLIKLLENLRDNTVNKEFNERFNEQFKNNKKRMLIYDNIIKSKAIKNIERFEGSFIDELHSKSTNLKKVNLDKLSDKEFIEWLDRFMISYYTVLEGVIISFTVRREFHPEDLKELLQPTRLKELAIEFGLFVESIRDVLDQIPSEDKISFVGEDIKRIESKDYDLVPLSNKMIEPVMLESNLIEV